MNKGPKVGARTEFPFVDPDLNDEELDLDAADRMEMATIREVEANKEGWIVTVEFDCRPGKTLAFQLGQAITRN